MSIAVVHAKVINCKSGSEICLLQIVHTKAIAALTQFCDFFCGRGKGKIQQCWKWLLTYILYFCKDFMIFLHSWIVFSSFCECLAIFVVNSYTLKTFILFLPFLLCHIWGVILRIFFLTRLMLGSGRFQKCCLGSSPID